MEIDVKPYIDLLEYDTARVVKTIGGKLFLIIGNKKDTRDNVGQWYANNMPINFDYLEEKCVASGHTHLMIC